MTVHIITRKRTRSKLSVKFISSRAILSIFMVIISFMMALQEMHVVNGNVELIDKETHLYTEAINYDVKNKIARLQ